MHNNDQQQVRLRSVAIYMDRMDFDLRRAILTCCSTLIIGTGEMLHGQLLRMGERIYGDPATGMQYSFLALPNRHVHDCERNLDIDQRGQQQIKADAADEYADFFGSAFGSRMSVLPVLQAQQVCEESYLFYDKAIQHVQAHPSIRAVSDL